MAASGHALHRQHLGGPLYPSTLVSQLDAIGRGDEDDDDPNAIPASSLVFHADGLCSTIFRVRLPISSSDLREQERASSTVTASSANNRSKIERIADIAYNEGGLRGWVCIKRVIGEEQPRPHDVNREIQILSRLEHVNIVTLIAAFRDTTDPFGTQYDSIMPLLPFTLAALLDEPSFRPEQTGDTAAEEVLPRPEYDDDSLARTTRPVIAFSHLWSAPGDFHAFSRSIARQILSGLAYMHEQYVASRDVKPSNMMFTHSGTLKLIDLGTAWEGRRSAQHPGDEGLGRMVCDVGTGAYRAPELLFAPTHGYDPFKIDIWSAGVVIANLFTPLHKVEEKPSSRNHLAHQQEEEGGDEDGRPDWERALWDGGSTDDDGDGDSEEGGSRTHKRRRTISSDGSTQDSRPWWVDDEDEDDFSKSRSITGYRRETLFDGSKGDIGLAGSIFGLLGLPADEKDWPEAATFQPPLSRLMFAKRDPSPLADRLPYLSTAPASAEECDTSLNDKNKDKDKDKDEVNDTDDDKDKDEDSTSMVLLISSMLRLSASKRPTAAEALRHPALET